MTRVKNICREPLLHFMLIGAALFLLFGLTQEQNSAAPNRIVVDAGQVEQLTAQFERTWLRAPTEEELANLVETSVLDEVYYREALAMGLDQNDPLIRRRMRQKLEFILEDLTAVEPSEEALIAFLQQHPDKFRIEPQISFRQIYLNPDKHRDMAGDGAAILAQVRAGKAPETLGDQTLMGQDYALATQSEIARGFGEEFALDVVELEPGNWTGPLYSGLGGHLVLVTDRREGRLPELEEIRAQVEREYMAQRRKELKDVVNTKLLERYEVVAEPQETTKGKQGEVSAATPPGEAGQ